MAKSNIEIDVIFLIHKETGDKKIVFESKDARGNEPFSLWRGVETGRYAIYDQEIFVYNSKLSGRFKMGNMIYPELPLERMIEIDYVHYINSYSCEDYFEIVRGKLNLTNVPVNEV